MAVTNSASPESIGRPRVSVSLNLEPSRALPAVAPRRTSTSGWTTSSSAFSHGRQASTSKRLGVLWIRRLPRSSDLKSALVALVALALVCVAVAAYEAAHFREVAAAP